MASTDAAAIQARMDAIQAALTPGFRVNPLQTHEDAIRERDKVAELQREFAQLQARLPKMGAEAGVLEINGRLGGWSKPPEPERESYKRRDYDPFDESTQDWRFRGED